MKRFLALKPIRHFRATHAVTGRQRGVELTDAVPLLGDLLGVDALVSAADQRWRTVVVAVGIDPVDVKSRGTNPSVKRSELRIQSALRRVEAKIFFAPGVQIVKECCFST